MPSLSDQAIREVLRMLHKNGTGPGVITGVAKQYGVTEAVIRACGRAITETRGGPPLVTESGSTASTSSDLRHHVLAGRLADQVNVAESKPIAQATIQELNALAAAYI